MQDLSLDHVQQPIKGYMQERFPALQRLDLDSATELLQSNAIDSLGLLELIAYIEETFDVALDDDDLSPENFDSIDRIARLVIAKQTR